MKALKILLAVLTSIAALVVLAAVLLAVFFDPNDYKGYVTSWVEERTGRMFAIEGDLELAFFPWLAIETEGVTLGSPAGFDPGTPFARIERIAAGVKLLPLVLERRLEIGRVRLDGVRLDLERGPDGRGNWEDFGGAPAADADPGAEPTLAQDLDIESVEIRGAEVRWHEAGRRLRYVLRDIRLATGRIRTGAPVDAALALSVLDVDSERTYDVEAESRVALAALGATEGDTAIALDDFALSLGVRDADTAALASGRIEGTALRASADGRVEIGPARVSGSAAESAAAPRGLEFGAEWSALRFDPTGGELAIDDLLTHVAGVSASWQLEANNVIDAPEIEGRVAIANAPIGSALASFGIALPEDLDPAALGALDAATRFRVALVVDGAPGADGPAIGPYRLTALDVDGLELAALGLEATGRAELASDGRVRADVDVPAFSPSDALLALVAGHVPDGIDPSAIDRVAVSGRAEIDVDGGRTSLQDVRVQALGAELAASANLMPEQDALRIDGTVRVSQLDAARVASLLGDGWPADLEPAGVGPLALDARFTYDGEAGRLTLDDLTLQAFGLTASGRAAIAGLAENLAASGELRIAGFSPRDVLRRFGQPVPETSDPAALARASLAARFDASASAIRVSDVDLALDDSRITGDFAVEQLDAATPTYRFTLAIDRVNADRYLPPTSSAVPDDADTRTTGDIELPADALKNLAIDGRVTVGRLRLAGLLFTEVSTGIEVGGGRASLSPARAQLYGGEFDGALHVDTTSEPGMRLVGRATSLRLEPLITALTGDANFSGIGDFDLDLAGRGAKIIDNVATANGNVRFEMRDGAIDGFNLGRGMCVVYNATQRLPAPAEQPDVTEYQLIRGTASVRDGVASSNDLLARASFIDLTGRGTLVLAEQRLDYSLEATLTGSTGIRGCEAMDDLVGESLPLVLRGTVTDPQIRPDFSEIIERRLRDAVRDRVQDRLQERLRDLLR